MSAGRRLTNRKEPLKSAPAESLIWERSIAAYLCDSIDDAPELLETSAGADGRAIARFQAEALCTCMNWSGSGDTLAADHHHTEQFGRGIFNVELRISATNYSAWEPACLLHRLDIETEETPVFELDGSE